MTRRSTTGSPGHAARTLTGRVVRRVGGVVLAASVGALAATLAVAMSGGPPSQVEGSGTPDRTGDRPSRALTRDAELTGGLVERLLPAGALPVRSPDVNWSVVHTELHEPRALAGSCHRFPLVSVGAIRVAHRAYALGRPASPVATAEHVVARFADARTAWRAHEVLLAWQADCGETLADLPGVRLTGVRDVDEAQRYAVAWTPESSDARVREDVALLKLGSRIALVRVTAPAADRRTGRETVAAAVRDAGELLD